MEFQNSTWFCNIRFGKVDCIYLLQIIFLIKKQQCYSLLIILIDGSKGVKENVEPPNRYK